MLSFSKWLAGIRLSNLSDDKDKAYVRYLKIQHVFNKEEAANPYSKRYNQLKLAKMEALLNFKRAQYAFTSEKIKQGVCNKELDKTDSRCKKGKNN